MDAACQKVRMGQGLSYREALMADRMLAGVNGPSRRENMPRSVRVALGGNIATDFLEFGLRVGLAAMGVDAHVHATSYNNWIAEALSESAEVDFWIVWETAIGATLGGTVRKEIDAEPIGAACSKALGRGQRVILLLPEALEMEDDPFSPFRAWRNRLSRQLEERLPEGVVRLSVDHVQRQVGSARWFAPRYWTMAKAPCHPDAATMVAIEVAKTVAQALVPRIKAVVTDLDNTLWGGVIGDDGVDGIKLDPFGEGRPYLMMQQYLKDLQATGIPLNVVSKNDPVNACAPFEKNPWMPLLLDDFVYFNASWEPKHIAIRNIAEQLNLGLDAICFLDDSPHERAEAKKFLPQLVVPELATDPEQRVVALARSGLFFSPVTHKDDISRVKRYRDEIIRRQEKEEIVSLDAYHEGLAMILTPLEICASNIARAAALVQKTNQFNVTNLRHTLAEIQKLTEINGIYGYCFSLSDRFGDSGIVSVVIGLPREGKFEVNTWVLSCRAFGRGVEYAILQHLMEWLQCKGVERLHAPFTPSAKNKLARDFLIEAGFSQADDVAGHASKTIPFTLSVFTKTKKHTLTIKPAGNA
ncbi:MAG: HAD-IIIC family phosphatase [Magnetococcus sp. MYC-9]